MIYLSETLLHSKMKVCRTIIMKINVRSSYQARINETIPFFARRFCFFLIDPEKNHTHPVSWQAWLLSWHPPSQNLCLYVPGPGPQAERKGEWKNIITNNIMRYQQAGFPPCVLLFCDRLKQQWRDFMLILLEEGWFGRMLRTKKRKGEDQTKGTKFGRIYPLPHTFLCPQFELGERRQRYSGAKEAKSTEVPMDTWQSALSPSPATILTDV